MCCYSNAVVPKPAANVESSLDTRDWFQALLRRHPIDFFLDGGAISESAALEDRLAVLDHLGVAAKVGNRVAGIEAPLVGVFAEDIVGAADLAGPVFVIPGAAYGGHVGEPGNFPRGCAQFVEISELPGPAGAVQEIKFVLAVEATLFPLFVQRAHVANERSHARHG